MKGLNVGGWWHMKHGLIVLFWWFLMHGFGGLHSSPPFGLAADCEEARAEAAAFLTPDPDDPGFPQIAVSKRCWSDGRPAGGCCGCDDDDDD
jgi:hypothetical protein